MLWHLEDDPVALWGISRVSLQFWCSHWFCPTFYFCVCLFFQSVSFFFFVGNLVILHSSYDSRSGPLPGGNKNKFTQKRSELIQAWTDQNNQTVTFSLNSSSLAHFHSSQLKIETQKKVLLVYFILWRCSELNSAEANGLTSSAVPLGKTTSYDKVAVCWLSL